MSPGGSPTSPPLNLGRPGRYHVVGVGGPGMSAIALTLAEMGHAVSGSDLRDLPVLDRLRAAGVSVCVGHDRANVAGVDAVRPVEVESTGRGAAMLAGIGAELSDLATASKMVKVDRRFSPAIDAAAREAHLARWRRAIEQTRSR